MIDLAGKNILFFQNSILPSIGGVCRVTDVISKQLVKRGHKCFYVFYEKDNQDYPHHKKLKVDIKQKHKIFEEEILSFIVKNKINVIICQYANQIPFLKVYKKFKTLYPDFPIISFLHASPDYWQNYQVKNNNFTLNMIVERIKNSVKMLTFPIYNYHKERIKTQYNISDKYVLLSETFRDNFIKIYDIKNQNKLYSIPNPNTFEHPISREEMQKKEKIVLIISRLDEQQKRILTALQIWQQLPKEFSEDWKLFIIGEGPDEALYKKYVSVNKLRNITFLGQQNNVLTYYKQAAVLIMTSSWEGLPMSLLESQQNGVVPIAFNNFSAVYDVINHEKNGFIIKNNDVIDFKEKLILLLGDEGRRKKMALNCIDESRRFDIDKIVDDWETIINRKTLIRTIVAK